MGRETHNEKVKEMRRERWADSEREREREREREGERERELHEVII